MKSCLYISRNDQTFQTCNLQSTPSFRRGFQFCQVGLVGVWAASKRAKTTNYESLVNFLRCVYWWLIQLLYWFKVTFYAKFWEIHRMWYPKYRSNFTRNEIQPMWGQIDHWKTRKTRKKLEFWNVVEFSSSSKFSKFSNVQFNCTLSLHIMSPHINSREVRLTQGEI